MTARPRSKAASTLLIALVAVASLALAGCSTGNGSDGGPAATLPGGLQPGASYPEISDQAAAIDDDAEDNVPCESVDSSTWKVAESNTDLPTAVGTGGIPSPLPPHAEATKDAFTQLFASAEDFLAQSNVPDPEQRLQVMLDAGFRGGAEAEWRTNGGYTVSVLNFDGAPGAVQYFQARLPNICGAGGTSGVVRPLSKDGGITWIDVRGAVHAVFFMGGSQVSLIICGCYEDPTVTWARDWYRTWMEQFAAGPTKPID